MPKNLPHSMTPETRAEILRRLEAGEGSTAIARNVGVSRQTIYTTRDAQAEDLPPEQRSRLLRWATDYLSDLDNKVEGRFGDTDLNEQAAT
jgi:transposase-like protein